MKKTILWLLVLTLCLSLCACGDKTGDNNTAGDNTTGADTTTSGHIHSWKDATCTTQKTCADCGQTEGTVGDHTYTPTCEVCGQTNADFLPLLNNDWKYVEEKDGKRTKGSFQFYEVDGELCLAIDYTFYVTVERYAKDHNQTEAEARQELEGGEMLATLDGKEYVFDGWGLEESSERICKEEKDTLTVEFMGLNWDDNGEAILTVKSTAVLKRTAMNQLTVMTSTNEMVPVGLQINGEEYK